MNLFVALFVEVSVKLQNKSLHLPYLHFAIKNLDVLLLTSHSNLFGCSLMLPGEGGVSLNSGPLFSFFFFFLEAQTLTYPWKSITK